MIPVEIGLIDISNDTMREAAKMLLPEYVFNEPGVKVLGAVNDERGLVGVTAFGPVSFPEEGEEPVYRIFWFGVRNDCRREGIGTILMDAVVTAFAESDSEEILTVWYDKKDASDGFGAFMNSTGLFTIEEDKLNRKTVYIAIWNGETYETLEEKMSEDEE